MSIFKKLAKKLATQMQLFTRMATGTDDLSIREFVAKKYLKGMGIEIGALDKPMPLPKGARVRYLDRMSVEDLRLQYPDYRDKKLVEVDIVDDGQVLGAVPTASQDFVIANHFLEHCPDPIKSLENMFRVLRDSGVLFLSVPDKRYTFDRHRPVTEFAHLARDFREGPEWSRRGHFEEWVNLVENAGDARAAAAMADDLMRKDYSIHFHVWTQKELIELFLNLGGYLPFQPEIQLAMKNGAEVIIVVSKGTKAG